MSLSNLIGERVTVGEFLLRSPTVTTLVRMGELYALEISAAQKAGISVDVATAIRQYAELAEKTKDQRAIVVLRTCVDAHESAWRQAPIGQLVELLLHMVDLSLVLPSGPPSPVQRAPGNDVRTVCAVAKIFGCAPHDVMDWPIGSYMAAKGLIDEVEATQSHAPTVVSRPGSKVRTVVRTMFHPSPDEPRNGPIN